MREFEASNHLLYLFEAGVELELINADTHIREGWNGNCEVSMMEVKISNLLNVDTIPQHFEMAFKQQTMIGWEQLFMGKMARGWRQYWPDKTYWRLSIVFTFIGWGRAYWRHHNRTLYGERQDKDKMTTITIDGRSTCVDGSTQNRVTNPTSTWQVEAETFEESIEFRHYILAWTQQDIKLIWLEWRITKYINDSDASRGVRTIRSMVLCKDSKS